MLLFFGHGMWEGLQQHGSLVCSFRQLVSAEAIERAAVEVCFRSTFVRLLNTCCAEVLVALGEPVRLELQSARDEARLQAGPPSRILRSHSRGHAPARQDKRR